MMSARRAPIALRMPISFVRSVTDTSMMFMTPMPPTSRPTLLMREHEEEDAADDLVELGHDAVGGRDREVVGLVVGDAAAAAAAPRGLIDRLLDAPG